jgi:DNA invertase Pin-like site-specific DNA recombinase
MGAARLRRFDALLVWRLDRLARSVRHLTTVAGELEALGIDLIVPGQSIDTSTPTGRLLFNVLGAIAEFERDLIRERVVAGMKAAKRRGRAIGRPRRLGRGDERRIARLRRSGRSLREIADLLGVSKSTVGRLVADLGAEGCPERVLAEGVSEPRNPAESLSAE